MNFNLNKVLIFSLSLICLILLSTTIYVNNKSNNKLEANINSTALDTISSVLEVSSNTYKIYEFALYQFQQNIININDMSKSIQNIINLYNTMIEMTNKNSNTSKYSELHTLTLQYLKKQQGAYMDFKSAVDLTASNFNETGHNKLKEAEEIKTQINNLINNYR